DQGITGRRTRGRSTPGTRAQNRAGKLEYRLVELTTPPDPNWFYSSVAQSAAAFAGLFGALLISRFLHQLGVVRESRSNVVRRFHRVRGQVDNLYSQTVQYALNVRDELAKDEATIERELKTRHGDV